MVIIDPNQKEVEDEKGLENLLEWLKINFSFGELYTDYTEIDKRKSFWENIYQPREGSSEKFRNFLDEPETFLAIVTGPVGCGKSTFVLEKMEVPEKDSGNPICGGIRISLTGLLGEIENQNIDKQDSHDSYQDNSSDKDANQKLVRVNIEIAKRVRKRFLSHFIAYLENTSLQNDYLNRDLIRLPFVNQKRPSRQKALTLQGKAITMTAAAIILSYTTEYSTIFEEAVSELLDNNGGDAPTEFLDQFRLLVEYLDSRPENVKHIIEIQESRSDMGLAVYWLQAYSGFFSKEKALLFLDQGDSLPKSCHNDILRYAYDISNKLNGIDRMDEFDTGVRVVLAMRDNNLNMAELPDPKAFRNKFIVLATAPHGFQSNFGENRIPTIMSDIRNILLKRTKHIVNKFESDLKIGKAPGFSREILDEFIELATTVWNDEFTKGVRNANGWVDRNMTLFDLANESIRIALAMVRDATVRVQQRIHRTGLSYSEYVKMHGILAIRSRLIEWLFKDDMENDQLGALIEGERSEIQKSKRWCCIHRIILTILFNEVLKEYQKQGTYRGHMKVSDLIEKLERIFNCDSEDTIRNLLKLSCRGRVEYEFVRIEPINQFEKGSIKIQDKHVHITRRGVVFFLSIMQTPDYWRLPGMKRSAEYLPIREMSVGEAILVLGELHERLNNVFIKHREGWIHIITKDNPPGLAIASNDEPVFPIYSKHGYTLGDTFYLERVLESHYHNSMIIYKQALEEIPNKPNGLIESLDSIQSGQHKREDNYSENFVAIEAALMEIGKNKVYDNNSKSSDIASPNFDNVEKALNLAKQFDTLITELRQMKKWTRAKANAELTKLIGKH